MRHLVTRRLPGLMAVAAIVLLILGLVLLTVEVSVFRWTTQDHDFTGLTCGTPLDHPDWATGEPCDGAVNRQTAVAAVTLLHSVGLSLASIVVGRAARRRPTREAQQSR